MSTRHVGWQLGLVFAVLGAACGPVDGATGSSSEGALASTPRADEAVPPSVQGFEPVSTADPTRACNSAPAGLDPAAPPLGGTDPSSTLNPAPFGLTGYAFYRLAAEPPPPASGASVPSLELDFAAESARVAVGAPIKFAYQVTSHAQHLMYLLRPLDGSVEHLREPLFGLYLRDDTTGVVYRWGYRGLRFDRPNDARPDDVVVLEPDRRDPAALGPWVPRDVLIPVAGAYTLWVAYRYCGDLRSITDLGPDIAPDHIVRGEFTSRPVHLRVE